MDLSRRQFLVGAGATALLAGLDLGSPPPARADIGLSDPALHLLNRLSYGVRPADLRRAQSLGLAAYVDEQLSPERLRDPALRKQMARFRVLDYSRMQLEHLENGYEKARKALIAGMVTRAVFARAQLLERMVEFWSDHFNVASDGVELDYVIFQREAIRKNALGKFSDLLLATAQSPAMLYYLDNFLNVAEAPNENYAREVMELHTLGVDGGYTEEDIRNVARALTGWTVEDKGNLTFYFHLPTHDTAPKRVLGVDLPAFRGIEDGLDVLRILAEHPSTARFVCRKLCVRFVSDRPPDSLVDALTATWISSGGQIKPVLRQLFLSSEFAASEGQKLRRGLDFAIGAMRAAGTELNDFYELESMLDGLAQLPYNWHPPNGYPDVAPAWINTGALLSRWNAAFALTDGALHDRKGASTDLLRQIGKPRTVDALVTAVSSWVYGMPLSGDARTPFVTFASDGLGGATVVTRERLNRKAGALYGLMLASPAYQWR
jgi:uncharacterized protein (DUF1800 family)